MSYNISRSNRSNDFSVKGGRILLVNHILMCDLILMKSFSNIEHIFIIICFNNAKILLGCVYIPPNLCKDNFTQFSEQLKILYTYVLL